MAGSSIIVCDQRFDIGHPVVTFEESHGFSAYVPHRTDNVSKVFASDPAPGLAGRASRYRHRRLIGGRSDLASLRQLVRQVVIHLDGCLSARMCYDVLHNQRGLSVHFLVDNDGTIYQTLDLLHCAFHAGGVNEVSVGIELQNRGDAARHPGAYPDGRETVTCTIHGHQFLSYDYTEAQKRAMVHLCRSLARVLDVPLASPHERSGELVWTTISGPRAFRGFLGHYHVAETKWDPGPWDFPRMLSAIGARVSFPFSPPKGEQQRPAAELARRYFDNSEQDVLVHFPVGPLGQSRLWHGGVHLRGSADTPVHAALQGRIVAARLAPPCPVGSCNFVLIQHQLTMGRILTFYSLYYHLAALETDSLEAQASWYGRARQSRGGEALEQGETALLNVPVASGELLGLVGEGGPREAREEQIHFAIFSRLELGALVDPGYWELVDGGERSRFCTNRQLLSRIDRRRGAEPPDGLLSRRELRNFFQLSPRRKELHRLVVRHRSEWSPGDWNEQLAQAPDFARLPPAVRRRLVATQITPTLWLTPAVASHAGLPENGVVYAYHPLGFLIWLERVLKKAATTVSAGIGDAQSWQGKLAPSYLTVDRESGREMTDEEDYHSGESGRNLTLEDLVKGYPDE